MKTKIIGILASLLLASTTAFADRDMVVTTTARFFSGGQQIDPFQGPDYGLTSLIGPLRSAAQLLLADGRVISQESDLGPGDGDLYDYYLIQTSLNAPSKWQIILPPLQVAITVAGFIEPYLSPAALALGALVSPIWLNPDASTSDKLLTLPPELQGPAVAAAVASAAQRLVDITNWAITLGGDGFDRATEGDAVLVVDKSSVDHVSLLFHIDTTNGSPIGWVKSAPAGPDGSISDGANPLFTSVPFRYGDHDWTLWMDLYPKNIPEGTYDLVVSTKENCYVSCLSTVHHVRLQVMRSCVPEGMGRDGGTCRICNQFESLNTTTGSCDACPCNGYRDPNDITQCVVCGPNQQMKVLDFFPYVPYCSDCPAGWSLSSDACACSVATACWRRDLGFNDGGTAQGGDVIGDAQCLAPSGDTSAHWDWTCGLSQYLNLGVCTDCPVGDVADPSQLLSPQSASSCWPPAAGAQFPIDGAVENPGDPTSIWGHARYTEHPRRRVRLSVDVINNCPRADFESSDRLMADVQKGCALHVDDFWADANGNLQYAYPQSLLDLGAAGVVDLAVFAIDHLGARSQLIGITFIPVVGSLDPGDADGNALGWANPVAGNQATVQLFVDGNPIDTVIANQTRGGDANPVYFSWPIPAQFRDGQRHTLAARVGNNPLQGSPRIFQQVVSCVCTDPFTCANGAN